MRLIINASLHTNRLALIIFLVLSAISATAQQDQVPGTPLTLQNTPQRDTSNKTNTSDWADEKTVISYKKYYSQKTLYPDTSLHSFHRRVFSKAWQKDLGNLGSPSRSLLFSTEYRTGPTLGYHAFDIYRFHIDSLNYYNTTRPYSSFVYQLGSRAEQMAEILHTQNISPRWNFAVQYRKINSPGNYKLQRTNHDFGNVNTHYKGKNLHYELYGAFVYNKAQHDENGGIVSDSFLTDSDFGDRRTIPVRFDNESYSLRRSSVSTVFRDFSILLNHGYTFGRADTLYNEDSTEYTHRLIPRFRLSHRLQIGSEKYQYKDLRPDSLRYLEIMNRGFNARDSVFMEQYWVYVDNAFMLDGFIGQESRQLLFSAGFGTRADQFRTNFATGENRLNILSNYVTGTLRKEAMEPGQWNYEADARFYLTGDAAGNFLVKASLGKDIRKLGTFSAGFRQELNNAPYSYTYYQNQYMVRTQSYNKESVTQLFGTLSIDKWKLSAGVRNYLVSNYIYLNQAQDFDQYTSAFNITQVWLKKVFTYGIFVLDNELAYQQQTTGAPVNVPALLGRHQLSIETRLFGNALKVATGLDVRYHTAYKPAGYSPFFNRFYYQDSYEVNNPAELAVFFSFKVKNFRAYVMGDQINQFFSRNVINAPGYPAQDAMIRFGFNWVLIN